jgi:hypothetical protein
MVTTGVENAGWVMAEQTISPGSANHKSLVGMDTILIDQQHLLKS